MKSKIYQIGELIHEGNYLDHVNKHDHDRISPTCKKYTKYGTARKRVLINTGQVKKRT